MSKWTKDKKLSLIIVLGVFVAYYVIGYIFKTDILNAITFRRHGFSISFVGIFLLLTTTILIAYIVEAARKYIEKRKNR